MEEVTDQEARGNYAPARFERLRPKQFELCLKMLNDKWPKIEIAQALNVTEKTVCRVADRHADRITELEAQFAKKCRRVAWDQLDRIERNPGIIPAPQIAQTIKYVFETGQLAEGRPTEIIEERRDVNIYQHWRDFVSGKTIGLNGEKLPPIDGELVASPAGALPTPGDPGTPGASGFESDGLPLPTQGKGLPGSNFSDDLPAETGARAESDADTGGGAAGEGLGPHPATQNETQKILPMGNPRV